MPKRTKTAEESIGVFDRGCLKVAPNRPCWLGYEMYGFKELKGRRVPNCVPKRALRNPARAATFRVWSESLPEFDEKGQFIERDRYHVTHQEEIPPILTEGHQDLAEVKRAKSLALVARRASEGGVLPRGVKLLGKGNFGVAYAVVDPETGATSVVKLPSEVDIHGRSWSLKEQIYNLMQEAGVANELKELGFGVVPRIVYVEFDDGLPALVREYGEPVKALSPREFEELEVELFDIEGRGWSVQDEIQLYRRDDGSIFVGDVGIWRRATQRDGKRDLANSLLPGLLRTLAHDALGAKPKNLPTLPWMSFLTEELQQGPEDFLDVILEDAVEAVNERRAAGLSVPAELEAAVLDAQRRLG